MGVTTPPDPPAQAGSSATKQSWRDTVKVHPAADLFPPMNDAELDELGRDIKKNGLQHKLVFWAPNHKIEPKDYQLLDGRNRIEAMVRAGVQVDLNLLSQMNCAKAIPDPYAYVVSANIQRRHLTAEQKDDLIVKVLAANPAKSDREVAKTVKVDHKKVGRVRKRAEATGAVAPVEKRTGADGKTRKQPARRPSSLTSTSTPARARVSDDERARRAGEQGRWQAQVRSMRHPKAAGIAAGILERFGADECLWLCRQLDFYMVDVVGALRELAKLEQTDPVDASAEARKAEAAADEAGE